jgi:hypothetical protein
VYTLSVCKRKPREREKEENGQREGLEREEERERVMERECFRRPNISLEYESSVKMCI